MSEQYVVTVDVYSESKDMAEDLMHHLRAAARAFCAMQQDIEVEKFELIEVQRV